MKSTNPRSSRKKSASAYPAAAQRRRPAADEAVDDDVVFVGYGNGRTTRLGGQRYRSSQSSKVKQEKHENFLEGEARCPVCKHIPWFRGCKMLTCKEAERHPSKDYVHYCGYCRETTEGGQFLTCNCPYTFDREHREAFLNTPYNVDEDEDTSAPSTQSPSASDEMDSNGDSGSTDLEEYTSAATSEADVNEDEDVAKEVPKPMRSGVAGHRAIKQEPDAVPSKANGEDKVSGETVRPSEVKSGAVPVKVKSEVSPSSTSTNDESMDASKEEGGKEEDIGVLIYQESQRRKREEAEWEDQLSSASKRRRKATSTGKASTTARADMVSKGEKGRKVPSKGKRKSSEDEEEQAPKKVARKQYKKCSTDGCNNQAVQGGVCMRHGAKVKRCSTEGCTNFLKKGGVCKKHGAKVQAKRCSFEGCTNIVVKGGVCIRHGANVTRCSSEGCTNIAQKGGVCIKHGATWTKKKCSSEGCTQFAQNGGVCIKHGATRKRCSTEGCTNIVVKRGVCKRHGANRS